jgi:hypothetical protein
MSSAVFAIFPVTKELIPERKIFQDDTSSSPEKNLILYIFLSKVGKGPKIFWAFVQDFFIF